MSLNSYTEQLSNQEITTLTIGSVPCLKNRNEPPKIYPLGRRVLFHEDDRDVVTGFLEPANPWEYAFNVSKEDLVASYKSSCEKHNVRPLSQVISQIQGLNLTLDRNEILDLKEVPLGPAACETLEEILKRVQFVSINLEGSDIDDESAVALFDMMEYYESAIRLDIAGNHRVAARGWQACSRMIKRTKCLEELDARNTTLNEQIMPILSKALRLATQLHALKLEQCNLSGRPIVILAAGLKLNTGLKELYLGDNFLMENDAAQLSALLKVNTVLQLLDISNNMVKDEGFGFIVEGLLEQSSGGLQVLVAWNNRLTRNCGPILVRLFSTCTSLETLNIGQNVLSNEVIHVSKLALQKNRSLLRLGMQSTHLSCEGAVALAEIIADNPTIQRIDLRDNNLQVAGLMALCLSMKVNHCVTQLDLDDMPRRKHSMGPVLEEYMRLVKEIRGYCVRNTKKMEESEIVVEETLKVEAIEEQRPRAGSFVTRKISLTCETLARSQAQASAIMEQNQLQVEPKRTSGRLRSPAPSPIPSPVASPSPTRSRFQVSRVSESDSPLTPPSSSTNVFFGGSSRFKVTVVESSATTAPTTIVTSNKITVGFETPSSLSPNISISPAPSPTPIPAPLLSSIPCLFPTPMPSPMPSPGMSPSPSPTYISPLSTINVGEAIPLSPYLGQYDKPVLGENSHLHESVIVSDTTTLDSDKKLTLSDNNNSVDVILQINDNSVVKDLHIDRCDLMSNATSGHPYIVETDNTNSNPLFSFHDSVSPPKVCNLRSESEDSEKDLLLNRKLPKAIDSIDLSALRVVKQASMSVPEKQPTPSQRVRKISSWVQPSTIFSSVSQDDSGKPTSSLEKLLGLFVNPFLRSKTEEGPPQQLERVPEVAENVSSQHENLTTDIASTTLSECSSKTQQSVSSNYSTNEFIKYSIGDNNKDCVGQEKKEPPLHNCDKSVNYDVSICPTRNGCEAINGKQDMNLPFDYNKKIDLEFGGMKCKTWPQGSSDSQLNLVQPTSQTHSSPCLTALLLHMSTAKESKISPPTSDEPSESTKRRLAL